MSVGLYVTGDDEVRVSRISHTSGQEAMRQFIKRTLKREVADSGLGCKSESLQVRRSARLHILCMSALLYPSHH